MTRNRRVCTETLTQAGIDYLTHLRYAVYREVGVVRWGKLRCDLLALNQRTQLIALEVKSCWADFKSDPQVAKKYLPFVDRFYFVFSQTFWEKYGPKVKDTVVPGTGVLILAPNGYLKCVVKCTLKSTLTTVERYRIVTKLAWVGATYSKKNRKRRTRRYIE